MSGVVLCLDGPLQAWGGPAGFTAERPTETLPSLSGIVGLIANALGRTRTDSIDDLARAELAVRADRPGLRIRDFHTVGTEGRYVPSASGTRGTNPIVTERWYLADATFVAVFTPDPSTGIRAEDLHERLQHPHRPLYLGRRSCPPATPVSLGHTTAEPAQVLEQLPLLDHPTHERTVTIESTSVLASSTRTRIDQPVSFDSGRRDYTSRAVRSRTIVFRPDQCAGRGPGAVRALMDAVEALP
jgi:CRISPR system Cascade subunit CasD